MAIVDVRTADHFAASRVEGSVNIPMAQLNERLFELPAKEQPLQVIYDDETGAAVELLDRAGWAVSGVHCQEARLHAEHTERQRLWEPCEYVLRRIGTIEAMTPGRLALDLGCGCGRDAAYLASRGWKVIGVENRQKLALQARGLSVRYGEVTARAKGRDAACGPMGFHDPSLIQIGESLPFRQGAFDLILCVRFLHRPLLPSLTRYVAPGGVVLYSHFVDGVQLVGTPKHPSGYLMHGELIETLCTSASVETRLSVIDHCNATLPDGRPIVNFLGVRNST